VICEAIILGLSIVSLVVRLRRASGLERLQLGWYVLGAILTALAFIGAPKLVLLDEPTTGLDVESRRQAWDVVRSFRDDGGSVLLTTHYIDEAEALASRVIVIRRGMIVADDSVEAIRSRAGLARIRFRDVELPADLRDGARRESGSVTIFAADAGEAVRRLVEAKVPLHDLEVRRETLEEALGTIEGRGA